MADEQSGIVRAVSESGLAASHAESSEPPLLVAPATNGEFNRLRARLIPKACFKLEEANFEFDSSFILPLGLTFDAGPLKALLDKHPGAKLSIFGHADPVGRDDYNKTLSGRRAQALFGLLVRDVKLWEDLYFHHDRFSGKDEWGVRSVQIMLNRVGPAKTGGTTGELDAQTRQALKEFEEKEGLPLAGFNGKKEIAVATFRKLAGLYMDAICKDDENQDFRLKLDDFLARGGGKNGKGDFQGCGEFNPLMILSKDEKEFFDRKENHLQRNEVNRVNRRVMILLFRPGSRVDPARWPCPTVTEGTEGCRKRLYSDGEKRRANASERRVFEESQKDPGKLGTFACRFYERVAFGSPCEREVKTFRVRLYDAFGRTIPSAPFSVSVGGRKFTEVRNASPEGIVTLLDVQVPETCVINWGFEPQKDEPPELLFSRTIFLVADSEPSAQAAKKKLHNLGYESSDAKTNVTAFQLDFGHLIDPPLDPSGDLDGPTLKLLDQLYQQSLEDLRETDVSGGSS
jgi:hypothetical protein